jgi:cyanophycin synthetase
MAEEQARGYGLRWDAVIVLVIVAAALGSWVIPRIPDALRRDGVVRIRTADPDTFVLVSIGDVNLAENAERVLNREGGGYAFDHLREHLGGDALIANLEAPVAMLPTDPPFFEGAKHLMKPKYLSTLTAEGVTLVTLANNHAMDQGPEGLAETEAQLRRAGLPYVGIGPDREAARREVILDAGHTKVAVIGAFTTGGHYRRRGIYAREETAGVYELEPALLPEDVRRAREHADIVLFSVHWGANYRDASERQEHYARKLVKAGVDVVNGHGAHRAQKTEILDGVPVLYSLGNGTFGSRGDYNRSSPHIRCSTVARYTFADGALVKLELLPIVTDNTIVEYQAQAADAQRAEAEWEPYLQRGGVTWTRGDDGWYEIDLP